MPTAVIATTAALMVAMGAAQNGPPAEGIVEQVQARLDALNDFTATVHQELVVVSAGRTLKAEGTVAFKRPGKMRWTFDDGEAQIIVADGTTLWFYQPHEEQVLKAPFQAAFRSTTPISFLTGVGRISEDFDVTLGGRDGGRVQLALRPRRGEGELGRLWLTVDAESYDIVAAEIHDPLGNVTRLRFSDLRRNTGLADSLFRFEIPPGVDVIEAPIGY